MLKVHRSFTSPQVYAELYRSIIIILKVIAAIVAFPIDLSIHKSLPNDHGVE